MQYVYFCGKIMYMKVYSLSKDDTLLIKGMAIFSIILHNFFHKLEPSPGENEFSFDLERILLFFQQICEQPFDCINLLFSYLGHYGVQIFIFISGFGLTLSMLRTPRTWGDFVGARLKKLFPLLLTGIIVYLLSYGLFHSNIPSSNTYGQILHKLLFVHTLLPFEGTELVGPWWFFGLIFQLYILFPLLLKCIQRFGLKALFTIALVAYVWIYVSQNYFRVLWSLPLLQNAPGHMLEFSFGIWFALNKDKNLHWIWCLLAFVLFVLGNIYPLFFPATFISITIIFLFLFPAIKFLFTRIPLCSRFFTYLGGISMLLFATHAIFREPFVTLGNHLDKAYWGLLLAAIFMTVSIGVALASQGVYVWLCRGFEKIRVSQSISVPLERFCKTFAVLFFAYVVLFYAISGLTPFDERGIEPKTFNANIKIHTDDLYSPIANYKIETFSNGLYVHLAFDFPNNNAPSVVLDIPSLHWKDLSLRTMPADSGWVHYECNYLYYSSCFHTLKNDKLKLYFWNTDKVKGEVKNIYVKVTTK